METVFGTVFYKSVDPLENSTFYIDSAFGKEKFNTGVEDCPLADHSEVKVFRDQRALGLIGVACLACPNNLNATCKVVPNVTQLRQIAVIGLTS